MMFCSRWAKST